MVLRSHAEDEAAAFLFAARYRRRRRSVEPPRLSAPEWTPFVLRPMFIPPRSICLPIPRRARLTFPSSRSCQLLGCLQRLSARTWRLYASSFCNFQVQRPIFSDWLAEQRRYVEILRLIGGATGWPRRMRWARSSSFSVRLEKLYGPYHDVSDWRVTLFRSYLIWSHTSLDSDEERQQKGYASPEQCKDNFLYELGPSRNIYCVYARSPPSLTGTVWNTRDIGTW